MISSRLPRIANSSAALIAGLLACAAACADDWPQWRGLNRDGVWNETDVLEELPAQGLKICWRARIGPGKIAAKT